MTEIKKRLFYISVFRVIVISVILSTIYFSNISVKDVLISRFLFYPIIFSYLFSIIFISVYHLKIKGERLLILINILFDILIVSVFVYFTGFFLPTIPLLYLFVILYSSLFYGIKGILLISTTATFTFLAVNFLLFWRKGLTNIFNNRDLLLNIEVHIFGFFLVGILSGALSERVKSAKKRIAEQVDRIKSLEEYNEYILSSLQNGLLTTDRNFIIVKINEIGKSLIGNYNVVGENVFEVFHFDFSKIKEDIEKLRSGNIKSIRRDFEFIKNGERIFIGMSISLLFKGENNIVGYIFVFQDITKIQRMQQQLEIQKKMSAIGNLSAAIAHEIKNPLASLMGSIQVLNETLPLKGDEKKLINIVLRESKRLNSIVEEFLQFARMKKFNPVDIDIVELLKETLILLENSREKKENHKIVVMGEKKVVFKCDPSGIRQVYWNLITNSLKAMPDGGKLEIIFKTSDDFVKIIFKDSGIGMNSEELSSIFEPYSSYFEKGVGLGMSIVYNLVENMGGTIEVESEKNSGTTVILNFKRF